MLLVRILFFGSDFPLIKQGSAPVKIQKRGNFSLLFVQRVDKVLNFLYNKGGKDRKLHKLCCRYAVCFRYFCDVSYPQLRELKHPKFGTVVHPLACILPAAAGIETKKALEEVIPGYHVSYPQLRELKPTASSILMVAPSNVSYPQLRELKHSLRKAITRLKDVSYPQLRELKRDTTGKNRSGKNGKCILPATAGIETCG